MKTKLMQPVFSICFAVIILSGFTRAVKSTLHADEAEILHFEYTNFDGGKQYMNDKDTAFFPFINTSGHDITLINITSKNKYLESPYELIYPKTKITFKDQQRDTLFFRRINRGELKEGLYDQSWELTFEGMEKKQYLNVFCELQHNTGKLVAGQSELPTVNRGEIIYFQAVVKNTGESPVRIYPMEDWNHKGLRVLGIYPLNIKPDETETLRFKLETNQLYNTYVQNACFSTNTEGWNRLVIRYSGQLISENYPSILFDSTSLTLNTYQGGPGDFEFWFTNDGNEPLIISMVKTSCGCLVPSYYPKEPVMPGERNVIKIHYDTNRIGPINKSISVYTNVSDYPVILRVLGNIAAKE